MQEKRFRVMACKKKEEEEDEGAGCAREEERRLVVLFFSLTFLLWKDAQVANQYFVRLDWGLF